VAHLEFQSCKEVFLRGLDYFVCRMPITVYMNDEDEGGLIAIAEYGQQHGKGDPIQVLYHGYGHYDALQIPAERDPK
jgi:pantothenate kinase